MRTAGPLDDADIQRFVADGFVRIEGAFDRSLADAALQVLWDEVRALHSGFDPTNEATWPAPVVRLPGSSDEPFRAAADSVRLHCALDQLVGPGQWVRYNGVAGTFAIRFPHEQEPNDAGWHIDGSFPGPDGNWWVNHHSRDRALLMLFLFTDVGPDDAPTRIRVGSHLEVPKVLVPAGEAGVPFGAVTERADFGHLPVEYATGQAGDVYLCHPFLVHAADRHRGETPRVIAQPGLVPSAGHLELERADGEYSAVERALRMGLGLD
jgi:hypothetical protein